MRWQILATETDDIAELEQLLAASDPGWSVFYHIEKKIFFHLGYGGHRTLATGNWRRSLPNDQKLPARVLRELRHGETRAVRVADFRQLFKKLRAIQVAGSQVSRAFLLPDRLLLWNADSGREQYRTITLSNLTEVLRTERLLLEETYLKNNTAQQPGWQREIGDFLTHLKKQPAEAPAALYADEFSSGAALLQAAGWNCRTLLIPGQKEKAPRSFILPSVRSVLVLTNVAGSELPALEHNLEFWGRGVPGVQWKHIYGQIDKERISRVLQTKQFDLLIYRGHAEIKEGKLWVPYGNFFLTRLPTVLFLHFACTDFAPPAELAELPARWNLLPAYRLLDFDDSLLLQQLIPGFIEGGSPQKILAALQGTPFVMARR